MEGIYTIPLRDVKRVPRNKRSPKAMRYIREFIEKHMKAEDVIIDQSVNEKIWERGIEKIPSKIKVKAVKEDETVEVTLVEN